MHELAYWLGLTSPNRPPYLWWSGIAADLRDFIGALFLGWLYLHHHCRFSGCWRHGRPVLQQDNEIVPAHDQRDTIHLLRHYTAHHSRRGDPDYHLFNEAKRRLKRQGLWHCVINNEDCQGGPTLHHSRVEFAYEAVADPSLLGLHLSDGEFARWVESPGNLEVLCEAHHLPHRRFSVHSIPAADWEIVRAHKAGVRSPVEVETSRQE